MYRYCNLISFTVNIRNNNDPLTNALLYTIP